jgi:hypothetical protein
MHALALDSPLFSIYVHELWGRATHVAKSCEAVFAKCPVPESGGYIQVDPDVHGQISSLLADAANIKKLITVPDRPGFKETNEQFAFRVERTSLLKGSLGDLKLSETTSVEARNSVEHFDQYLDRANLALATHAGSTPGTALYNMVLSSWNVFDKKVIPLKLYVASERRYYNLEWSADLNALHAEAVEVVARVRKLASFKDHEGPGGLMVPIK